MQVSLVPHNAPRSSASYSVAWITALSHERAAAQSMFDSIHPVPPGFKQNKSDPNAYSWGRVGNHNVVLCSMPTGRYGTIAAATIAQGLRSSLPHIRIGLFIGIGAGIPGERSNGRDTWIERDIRLGDVVVSWPYGTAGGVVQLDMGNRSTTQPRVILKTPATALSTALTKLQAHHRVGMSKTSAFMSEAYLKFPKMKTNYSNPSLLEESSRRARDIYYFRDGTVIARRPRAAPEIHYGLIASSNILIKSAKQRDDLLAPLKRENLQPLCFEMEAAGLQHSLPCLVIRGICDYADERKNDVWQRYAALTAAAFAKELLQFVDAAAVPRSL